MDFLEQVSNILGTNRPHDIAVDKSLLVVGSGDLVQEFAILNRDKFEITITPFIEHYSGSLGHFRVSFDESSVDSRKSQGKSNADSHESSESKNQTFAQIAFFSAFDKAKKPQLGVHFIDDYENNEALCNEIDALIGDFSFEKTILFDEKKCQYFHRDKTEFSYCAECVAVCPTMAISTNDNARELVFSQIDCILCGKCVAVCPSGAMNKANATLPNLNKALKFYKGKIAVVCENKGDFETFSANLNNTNISQDSQNLSPQDEFVSFAPLVLPSVNMLNEASLLSILQESGRICVILGEIDSRLKECADFINELYNRVVGQKAVFISALDLQDFSSIEKMQLPYYHYEISDDEFLRQILANRVRFLTKERDFGVLENSANLIYTDLKIDADKCTLCNACVESCNAKALINAKDSFTLLLNPSLCTACGYCVDTCAENCLEMSLNGYALNESFLNYRVLAQDEPFCCVECGTIFATNKSINKVKSILSPAFMGDSIKLKSLECCEKCKVKIMFEKSSNFVGGAN